MQLRKLIRCRHRECRLKAYCNTDLSSSVVLLRSAGGVIGFTLPLNELYSQISLLTTPMSWSIIYYQQQKTSAYQNQYQNTLKSFWSMQ